MRPGCVRRKLFVNNPHPFEAIDGLQITPEVAAALTRDGIATPTRVQREAIPAVLQGRHVVLQSGTGTGKTLAYVLPILQLLAQNSSKRAVCFAPSTELAAQILRVSDRYRQPAVKTASLVAGGSRRYAQAKLQKSTQWIVGTPGRLLEQFEQRKLKGVTLMVLDEVEPVLGNKDAAYLREILSRPEPKVQLIFAAATFGLRAQEWIRDFMGEDVVRIQVEEDPLREQIAHRVVRVRDESRRDWQLVSLLGSFSKQRAIVFVNQPNLLRHLFRELSSRGLFPVSVSPERSKLQNQQALQSFTQSKARVLLITDAAATGLDIPDVPWVVHYELPHSDAAYVHRAGRTGRAGRAGCSIVFVSDEQRGRVEKLAEALELEPFALWDENP
ncbi:MAG: putative ATP-dependent helicase YfmL [Pseudomonadota bacterium]|jgi:superfamily II DNA/RNA helicase